MRGSGKWKVKLDDRRGRGVRAAMEWRRLELNEYYESEASWFKVEFQKAAVMYPGPFHFPLPLFTSSFIS
jgi:hypothetical protein